MVVVRLAKFECIDAAVILHPGPITPEQINGTDFPILLKPFIYTIFLHFNYSDNK